MNQFNYKIYEDNNYILSASIANHPIYEVNEISLSGVPEGIHTGTIVSS